LSRENLFEGKKAGVFCPARHNIRRAADNRLAWHDYGLMTPSTGGPGLS
jgi:hypothetical protein